MSSISVATTAAAVTTGVHFTDPWLMVPRSQLATGLSFYDASGTGVAGDAVNFFTGIASYGVIDSTNWTAATYKTIYSHTGKGLVGGMIACTAGGAETTTFEITIDGTLSEITVTNAIGERAMLTCVGTLLDGEFITTAVALKPIDTGLNAGLTTLQTMTSRVAPMQWFDKFGIPLLRYDSSCLIRMKHSVDITNSTATAYSGVMVRKGIAA